VEKKSKLVQLEDKKVAKKILEYLEKHQAFRNQALSLGDLSRFIGLKPYRTTQIINQSLQTTFYTLVNGHRIKFAQKLLADPAFSHFNMLGIAEESGFNSKSVFNETFKKFTGTSPSDYRRKFLNAKR
jgi:AraC-like DNA-binding protein